MERKSLFTRDELNALLCAIEVRYFPFAAKLSKSLLKKGLPYSYFEKRHIYKDFVKSKDWKEVLKEGVTLIVNLDLRNKLDSLLSRDQEFRYDYHYYIDTIRVIDSLNKIEILDIFNNYGYPTSNSIGIVMENDTTISKKTSLRALLIHQIKNHREQFIPILENFLYSGQMPNQSFVFHSKNFFPLEKYKISCFGAVQSIFIQVKNELFTCCCEEEEKINSLRKKYFLEPLSEKRLKAEFHYEKDSRFGFGGCSVKFHSDKGNDDLLNIKEELLEKGFII